MHNQPVGTLFLKLFFLPWVPQALVWNPVGCGPCGRHPKKHCRIDVFFANHRVVFCNATFVADCKKWA